MQDERITCFVLIYAGPVEEGYTAAGDGKKERERLGKRRRKTEKERVRARHDGRRRETTNDNRVQVRLQTLATSCFTDTVIMWWPNRRRRYVGIHIPLAHTNFQSYYYYYYIGTYQHPIPSGDSPPPRFPLTPPTTCSLAPRFPRLRYIIYGNDNIIIIIRRTRRSFQLSFGNVQESAAVGVLYTSTRPPQWSAHTTRTRHICHVFKSVFGRAFDESTSREQ